MKLTDEDKWGIIIILALACTILGLYLGKLENEQLMRKASEEIEIDSTEIIKDSLTKILIEEVSNVIQDYAPESKLNADSIVLNCIEYNVHPSFVLAQGINESHLGTKGLAVKTNSVWNVGSFDSATVETARCRYETQNESIKHYLTYLKNNYLVDKTEEDLLNNFVNIHGYRYASSLAYESNLRSTYNKLNRTYNLNQPFKILNDGLFCK